MVVNNMDDIMIEIKSNMEKYYSEPMNSIISEDTIIPGISGKKVNVSKSYKNMKNRGFYSDKLYIYDYIKPAISLNDNIDKYIIKGNPSKRMVTLIFKITDNKDISKLVNVLDNYNAKSTFFLNSDWFSNNNSYVKTLVENGHTVNPYMEDYTDETFEWMDIIIKKINRQSDGFCYNVNRNKKNLDSCILKNYYTIEPVEISEIAPLIDIKNKLESGSILSLKINSELYKELSNIIIYIKSKGYKLVNLNENVLE